MFCVGFDLFYVFFFLQVNFWTCLPQLQCFLRPFQSCKLEHRAQIVVTVKKKNMD